jgi:hypothetical protein
MRNAWIRTLIGVFWLGTIGASAAPMGEIGLFSDRAGWMAQAKAKEIADFIVANQKVSKTAKIYAENDIDDWAKKVTADGNLDILITFGDFPGTLYAPGNGQADGSVVEKFIEGGNMVLNTADYIFYVNNGAGTNGDAALKNITNSTFDLWTDGNVNKPTKDGAKYTPSLKQFTAPRSFKSAQVDADPNWDTELVLADNGGANMDPCIIKHVKTGGRVGIVIQVADDSQPRSAVFTELLNNWVKEIASAQAIEPKGKTSISWAELKNDFAY